eukprot:SAG11_NODE_38036_length_254_cov_0.664516_1_plen_40_part_10
MDASLLQLQLSARIATVARLQLVRAVRIGDRLDRGGGISL